ncbi:very-long-chain 3-oxoacyl-CoA reductase [Trichonephila inaurata madagascariensis]|uniref:Very-long-chain 3-oxoacyl-CoA reductase n=1 Tax=Trichonephila inaurata madagascariensis TaxID=2747483 RepID=A0A8X6WVB4_9ARAC|nr:very-long-chain 3-oxoacyl-CoA reductase [Trichonephila inaurata madagascariensis]
MSSAEKCDLPQGDSKGIVYFIGFIFICWVLFKLLRSICRGLYSCFLVDLIGGSVDWKKLGRWAVVTGSTDGIGKSYSKALAAKGFNIVLISRTQKKLEDVAQEIEKKYSVQTKTVAVDITDESSIYDKIRSEIQDLDIGVLVNNVGMSYPYAEYLTKVPNAETFVENLIKANIVSCTRMTLLVLPVMEKAGRGVILNISSLSALTPVPLLSMYSASKVYVNFFSKATQEEYKKKGIIVQSVLPGFVSTNMSKMRPSFTTCTPDAFVKWAMKTVGIETQTYGYPVHKLQGYAQEILAEYLPEHLNLAINHNMLNNIRKRYYKKYGLVDGEKKDK